MNARRRVQSRQDDGVPFMTAFQIPQTEGIKFAGSKLKLLPHILELAQKVKFESVFDAFAGTTRVSQVFAQTGYKVITNDSAVWSKVFAECYLKNQREENFYREIIEHLNNLQPKDGWFTEHYGGLPSVKNSTKKDGLKKPWQIHNTRRLDAIRDEIDKLNLAETEKSVLLTSLILALDRVDSTIGHYAAYLKEWSPRSFKTLKLKVPRFFESEKRHKVFCRRYFRHHRKSRMRSRLFRSAIRLEQRKNAAVARSLRGILSSLDERYSKR